MRARRSSAARVRVRDLRRVRRRRDVDRPGGAARVELDGDGAAALFGISLNFALIPPFGKIGAAASMLLAYFAMFLGILWKAQRVFPVHTSGDVSRPLRRPRRR